MVFGGPWCGNTQAVIKNVNEYANKYGITDVYTFDTKLDSNSLQIRDTKNPYAKLYVDLVRNYFPGIETEYGPERNIQYSDEAGNVTKHLRLLKLSESCNKNNGIFSLRMIRWYVYAAIKDFRLQTKFFSNGFLLKCVLCQLQK